MPITPDQERQRRTMIKNVAKDWEVRTTTLELARKTKSRFWKFINLFWKRKVKVMALYFWVDELFTQPNMMSYPLPLDHDNIRKPSNMPYIFTLKSGWTIPEKDLKYLYDGPLLSENGAVLVKPGGYLAYYWSKAWPVIAALGTLLGIIKSIYWIIEMITQAP